jgi:hypothetical protein
MPKNNRLADIVKKSRKLRERTLAEERGEEWVEPEEVEEEGEEETQGDEINQNNEDIEGDPLNEEEGNEGEEEPEVEEVEDAEEVEEEELVTIKVDGEELQVPKAKVYERGIQALQKQESADKKLEEANRRIREADLYEQSIRQKVEASMRSAQEQNQDAPLSNEQDVDIKAAAKRAVALILDGEEDEAAEILAEQMGRGKSATPVDVDTIVAQTEARVQQRIAYNKAVESFKSQYKDIAQDRFLWAKADAETNVVHAEHPDWDLEQVILEAGKRVQDWVDSLSGGKGESANQEVEQSRNRKREQKRTTENLKSANARKQARQKAPPPTKSEIVAKMRKSRGIEY